MTSAASTLLQMAWCVAGIYFSFGLWALLHEKLSTRPYLVDGKPEKFHFFFVVNFVQMATAAALAGAVLVAERVKNARYKEHQEKHHSHSHGHKEAAPPAPIAVSDADKKNSKKNGGSKKGAKTTDVAAAAPAAAKAHDHHHGPNPLVTIATVGFSCAFASPFSYVALKHVSYPAVLTAKMCKMVPVLLVGMLFHGTRYSWAKILDCVCITVGVLGFSFFENAGSDKAGGRSSSVFGLCLVAINLTLDGYTNATQDVIVKKHKWSGHKLMCGTNFSAACWTLLVLVGTHVASLWLPELVSSDAVGAASFVYHQPEAGWDLLQMGLLNGFGQFFLFRAMSVFGSLTVTGMTLVRKIGSVILSIWFHGHHVSVGQAVALGLVVVGVIIDTVINVREKQSHGHKGGADHHGKPAAVATAPSPPAPVPVADAKVPVPSQAVVKSAPAAVAGKKGAAATAVKQGTKDAGSAASKSSKSKPTDASAKAKKAAKKE